LEGLTGIYRGTLSHVEKGAHVPAPETLALLSTVLDIPLADLYQAAGYPIPDRPPSLRPYLRGNFGLPEDALDDVERYLELVTKAYANSPLSADHGEPTST
jgi:transcriptional regulator with XRE-family HTH domain